MSETLLLDHLRGLPPNLLEKMYASTGSALGVFRFLPPLAQQFVSRMAFISTPVPQSLLDSWINPAYKSEGTSALKTLIDLRIILRFKDAIDSNNPASAPTLLMEPTFQKSFQFGLMGCPNSTGISNFRDASDLVSGKYRKTVESLKTYSAQRWECLLQFLALPTEETQKSVSAEMRTLLASTGFVREPSPDQRTETGETELEITSFGFQFLLMEKHVQLWAYLFRYLRSLEQSKGQEFAVSCLSLIFRLSFASSAAPYRCDDSELAPLIETILHLRELGLVFMRKRKDGWFYVSPMATLLRGPTFSDKEDPTTKEGCLVIETNFRIYAYTDSMLELAILSSFCELTYRFGNMSVGLLTRNAARKAFQVGIKAQQIIDYLRAKAMRTLSTDTGTGGEETALMPPPSVSDQLRLWELERDRFKFHPAALYWNFESIEDFEKVRNFARDHNVLLWESNEKRELAVHDSGHEIVKQFYKQMKKSTE